MEKNKGGRKWIFDKSLIQEMEEYFDIDSNFFKEIVTTWKNDYEKIEHKEFASNLPTIQWFCRKIWINRDTFYSWLKEADSDDYKNADKVDKKKFSDTYKKCKEMQEAIWIENSLKWLYSPAFAIFLWKNVFWWKDKSEVETSWETTTRVVVWLPNDEE